MATWPTTLPGPISEGYGISPVDPVVRTDMEVGAPRARRRSHARNDRVEVTWFFSEDEFQTFRDWFDDGAAGAAAGAAWFYVDLKIGGGGMETVEARFSGIWKAGYVPSDHWRVTATLEVR